MNKINEPLVSVICTTFNHESFVTDAIEGFIMQNTSFKFEVLIHDDASTDGTVKIIKEYEKKYPDLINAIYQSENQYSKGVSIFKEFLYPKVRGKYIAICEGDDFWIDPLKLQTQVDLMEFNKKSSLCCHDAIMLWENKQKQPRLFAPDNLPTKLTMNDILNDWVIPTASMLFKSDVIIDLPNWSEKVVNGDFFLQLWCAHHGEIDYINKPMCVYRKDLYGGAVTSTVLYENKFRFEKFFELLDMFNKETEYVYNDIIEQTKKKKKRNLRYSQSKRKYGLLHYFLKPRNTINKLTSLIKKN
jgi:glycosyltransferase involved in cell wall biosynthesis